MERLTWEEVQAVDRRELYKILEAYADIADSYEETLSLINK